VILINMTAITGAMAVRGDRALITLLNYSAAISTKTALESFRNYKAIDFGKKFSRVYLAVLI
jgi:hypothetical protein